VSGLLVVEEYRRERTEKMKGRILIGKPLVSGCLITVLNEVIVLSPALLEQNFEFGIACS
jgi:hypothetical protein